MKKFAYATAILLVARSARAEFTAKVKCDAKASPTQTYVGVGPTVLSAAKAAIAKAEKDWGDPLTGDDSGGCYSIDVTPKPEPMFGCNTKYCPPGRGGFKR
jgi:hypothetical protein